MENDLKLSKSLAINPPTFYSLSDSVMNVSRFNNVNMNWSDLVEDISSQEYLRNYFLSNSLIKVDGSKELSEYLGKENFFDFYPLIVQTKERDPTVEIEKDKELTTKMIEVTKDVFCIVQNHPKRLYAVGTKNKYLDKLDIEPFLQKSVDDLWKEIEDKNYDYYLTYFDKKTNSLTSNKNPYKELVNRELLFYKEKFGHLSVKLNFIKQANKKINSEFITEILSSEKDRLQKLFGDSDLVQFYLSNFSRINLIEIELNKEIDIIKNKLFEKGYFLETEFSEVEIDRTKWGKTFKSHYGEIYSLVTVEEIEEIEIEVDKEIERNIYNGSWKDRNGSIHVANGENEVLRIGTRKVIIKEKIKKLVPRIQEKIIPVVITNEPIYEKILTLKSQGYWIHIFDNQNSSYFSNNDSFLSEIIQDCENSEETRINTVIVIKDYGFVDLTNKSVISATFYYHPVRGILPSKLPTVGIRENLDYRISWAGLEVGKLIDSICLAPGEIKTVSISNKFSTIISTTSSTKTFNELSSVDSTELTTDFEKLVSNELERANESSSSLSAGASYGGLVSANGEKKQGNKQTIKEFTKNLNKSTDKAIKTLSNKASVEVNFSTSTSVENASSSTKNSTITNINQGRTLNLYYYQLNNRFRSRVYLENLRLEISSSTELIEGSGIYDKFVTKLSNIDQIITLVKQYIPHLNVYDDKNKLSVLIKTVIQTLNEYINIPLLIKDEDEKQIVKLNSLNIINVPNQFAEKFNDDLNFEELLKAYNTLVLSIQFDQLYFNEETFIIDSGSYYLDSQVGVNPATEDYSEKMRELEALKIAGEIKNKDLVNDSLKIKNSLILKGMPFITSSKTFTKIEDNVPKTLTIIEISKPIDDNSKLTAIVNSMEVNSCEIDILSNKTTILIKWLGVVFDDSQSLTLIDTANAIIIL